MSDAQVDQAAAAHNEYLAEARRLVDEQVDALFARLTAAAQGAGQQPQASRDGHTLRVSAGGRAAVFAVEAITDLPEGSDRAQAFPASQARCRVQAPDGTAEEWLLHRGAAGDATPPYTWVHANTETPVSEDDMRAVLNPLFGS